MNPASYLVVEHVREITDRHLAEEALKESEGRFRTLIEDSPEVAVPDRRPRDCPGRQPGSSPKAGEKFRRGYRGRIVRSILPGGGRPAPGVRGEQVVATGRPVRFEDARDNFSFDNHINPILDAEGKVSMLSILAIDITDRRNAEQALRDSEARFRAIFDAAQDSIFIKDQSFRYVQVNPAMERLFGRSAAEIIGKTDAELFGQKPVPGFRIKTRWGSLAR